MRKFLLAMMIVVMIGGCSSKDLSDSSLLVTIAELASGVDGGATSTLLSGASLAQMTADELADINNENESNKYTVPTIKESSPLYDEAQLCITSSRSFIQGETSAASDSARLACLQVLEVFPTNRQVVLAHGILLLPVDSKAACDAFSETMVLGDSSAFFKYCNLDGSPKE